jgi:hypothetical protein
MDQHCVLHSIQVYGLSSPDPMLIAAYEKIDGVPDVLIDNAVFADTEEAAGVLADAFMSDRQGYANTRDQPSEADMRTAATDGDPSARNPRVSSTTVDVEDDNDGE